MSASPKYLFDECLGKPMMESLREALGGNLHFEHLCDLFAEGTEDNDWIPRIGREGGWIVITTDGGKKPNRGGKLPELCKEHKVTHILLNSSLHHKPGRDKQAALVLLWSQISNIHNESPGTRFKIRYRAGKDNHLSLVLEKIDYSKTTKSRRKK